MSKKIIVIGGGIAGTAATHTLLKLGYDVTILEKNDRLGGRIRSINADGLTFEMGAGFMTDAYTNLLAFIKETGLDVKLHKQRGNSGVFRGNEVAMPSIGILLSNRVIPLRAKIQAAHFILRVLTNWRSLDIHAPWKASVLDNRPVNQLFPGKAGQDLIDRVIGPVLNGYFYWTPEQTSEAMLKSIVKAGLIGGSYKLQDGLDQLPEAGSKGSQVVLECAVANVSKKSDGTFVVSANKHGQPSTFYADGIICATTASAIADMFELNSDQKQFFTSVKYSSTMLIAQTYVSERILLDRGFAFTRSEDSGLAAVSISSDPASQVNSTKAIKIYASGTDCKALLDMTEVQATDELVRRFAVARHAILKPDSHALSTIAQKWSEALPIFHQGYYKKLKEFDDGRIEDQKEALAFAGDYLGGPLMEGAFTSGKLAAERLHGRLQT